MQALIMIRCSQVLTEVGAQLTLGRLFAVGQYDGGADVLAELVVGDRKRDRFGDGRVPEEHLVDLDR